jgi:mannose-6-phosphate isomerase-like protein (cupin superfamily)
MLAAAVNVSRMAHAFGSIDDLGDGYGFRKVRQALGITSFGVNVVVMPPGYEGFLHYHEEQDELYFVHQGTARFEVDGEVRDLGPGGLCHVESTTPRMFSNAGDDDLVVLVVGAKGGYVGRDGQLVYPERDLERRRAFGSG